MAVDPAAVNPETDLRTATAKMCKYGCAFLPVFDAVWRVVGVLTDRGAAIAVAADDVRPSKRLVAEVMTAKPHTCGGDESIQDALRQMAEVRVRRLPVVNDAGRLVGAIFIGDLVPLAQNVRAGRDRVTFEPVMEAF